jgi:IK cytokine
VTPKKRTREDLIRELKERRSRDAGQSFESIRVDNLQLEEAKQKGKFKPIGFTSTSKRRKDGGTADRKKKKRKVDNDKKHLDSQGKPQAASTTDMPTPKTTEQPKSVPDEDIDDSFDIFAGAGEYTGVEIDEHEGTEIATPQPTDPKASSSLPQLWIAMDGPEHVPVAKPQLSPQLPIPIPESATVKTDQEVGETPMRLAPLESSGVPSIKELLDIHDAADKYERKLKRKEKKQRKRGGNGKGSDEE